MSNALEAIAPKILARGMMQLRQKAIMPRLINSDFSAEAAQKGDTIDIPIGKSIMVEDVTPSHTPPVVPDHSASTVSIKLNNWKRAAFYLTDKELTQIDADHSYVPLHMREAVSALASSVNSSVMQLFTQIDQIIGSPNNKLFTQDDTHKDKSYYMTKPVLDARKILNRKGAPKEGRHGVLSMDNESELLALPQFMDAHRTGDTNIAMSGEIGQKFGINWYGSDDIIHREREADICATSTNYVKGDTDLIINGVDILIEEADIIEEDLEIIGSVAKVGNNDLALRGKNITLKTGLSKVLNRSKNVTVSNSHYNNLVFHSDAFALAMRPLTSSATYNSLGNRIMSVTDPESGLSMRLEISRQYKQTVWEFDILWGVALVRPEWAVRLIG